jgi:large subunit ribosomal protein L33
MPKVKGGVVKLVSLAGTGIFYTTRKNPKAATKKLLLRKYDPMLQRHTLFRVRPVPQPQPSLSLTLTRL